MQRELWVGLAWAGGLLAAMALVFAYSAATFEFPEHQVTWTSAEESQGSSGTLDEGASDDSSFDVDAANVTRIEVTLTWTDDVGNNDEFRLGVAGPDNSSDQADGSEGSLTLVFDVAPTPEDGPVRAINETEALREAAPPPAWNGTQPWTVTVTLVSAPGTGGAVGNVGATADGANGFEVTFKVVRYVGSVAEA